MPRLREQSLCRTCGGNGRDHVISYVRLPVTGESATWYKLETHALCKETRNAGGVTARACMHVNQDQYPFGPRCGLSIALS